LLGGFGFRLRHHHRLLLASKLSSPAITSGVPALLSLGRFGDDDGGDGGVGGRGGGGADQPRTAAAD
jgi:hypothetical protein